MYFAVFLTILAAEYMAGLKMTRKKWRGFRHVPSMYFPAFVTIMAAEYTAGLKITGTNWREFRPSTLLLFLQFWPQSMQQDCMARVPPMYFIVFPVILAAEYAAGPNDRDHSTSSSALILYCQKGVGGMGEATK